MGVQVLNLASRMPFKRGSGSGKDSKLRSSKKILHFAVITASDLQGFCVTGKRFLGLMDYCHRSLWLAGGGDLEPLNFNSLLFALFGRCYYDGLAGVLQPQSHFA